MSNRVRETTRCGVGISPRTFFSNFRHLVLLSTMVATVFADNSWAANVAVEEPPTDSPAAESVVQNLPLKHVFTVVETDVGRVMGSGRQSHIEVTIRNDGDLTWTGDRRVRVSYRWRKADSREWQRGVRTELPGDVPPGATVKLTARVLTPEALGIYYFQWDMIEERVGWFSRKDPTPAPEHRVFVVPVQTLPFVFFLLAVTSIALLAVRRGRGGGALPAFIPPESDLYWIVLALIIKQQWVLASSGWSLSNRGMLATLATAVFVALLLLMIPQRVRPWTTWFVNAVLSLLLCADVLYVRFFDDLPSFAVFGAAEQTGQVKDSILSLFQSTDLWFFVDLLPALPLMFVLSRQRLDPRRRLVVAVGAALILVPGIWAVQTSKSAKGGSRFQPRFHLKAAQDLGVLGYHASSAFGLAREMVWGVTITEDDWQFVTDLLEERRPQRAGTGNRFGIARGYNLVMIQVESLQDQLLGLEIQGQEVTPTLNRLAGEGVSFSLCVDQTSFGRTSDAELLSQASLLPDPRGPAVFRHAGNDLVGLADVLGEHDYSTLVAVPFRDSFWNRRYSHPAFGFQTRLYDEDFERGQKIGWGLNDKDFLRQASARLPDLAEPFFAYLITLSNHHPFADFPEELEILDLAEVTDGPVRGYLHSMRWADEAVAELLAGLEASGLASRTVVVVFGDHGSGLRRIVDDSSVMAFGETRPQTILNGRVPVVIRVPGADAPRGEVDIPAGLVDLPPTIAALLGIDPGDLPWIGRNLFGSPEDGPVTVGSRAWVDGRYISNEAVGKNCFDRFTAQRIDPASCIDGSAEADRLRKAGTLILEGDLQQRLRTHLGGAAD